MTHIGFVLKNNGADVGIALRDNGETGKVGGDAVRCERPASPDRKTFQPKDHG